MPWQSSDFQSSNNNGDSVQIGVQIGLIGSLISIFGETVELIGGYIAFQEEQQADAQLQQELNQIRESIDTFADQNKQSASDGTQQEIYELQEERNQLLIKNLQLEISQLRDEKACYEKNMQIQHMMNSKKKRADP